MTTDIVAQDGSPMSVAVIGVEDMERSLHFYRDLTGLTAEPSVTWSGAEFESFWHLSAGAKGEAVFLHHGPDPVGRILLVQFDAPDRKVVRAAKPARAYGLINLNFYTADIFGETEKFTKAGYEFWSEPVAHEFTPDVGTPIEVVFEGPDGVLINWVELATKDPATRSGKMRAYVESFGKTKTGFTPVVTTASCMRDIEKSKEFYAMQAVFAHDMGAALADLDQPILVFNVQDDIYDATARSADVMKNGRVVDLSPTGLWPLETRTDEIVDLIRHHCAG